MRSYSKKINLIKNTRGCWVIDPVMGCKSGIKKNKKGCFSDCYAARNARIYGYNFGENILKDFENKKHLKSIIKKANNINFPFIRVGSSGDPSENWDHTITVLEKLKEVNKKFIIITRHWNKLNTKQLKRISKLNICINTSVSAINDDLYSNIHQYDLLKDYCKSILRCVSFDFNIKNEKGLFYSMIQNFIFDSYCVLDTVFRCSKSNTLYKEGVINISETKFLGKKCYVSKYNKNTYFGSCENCKEKCGLNI